MTAVQTAMHYRSGLVAGVQLPVYDFAKGKIKLWGAEEVRQGKLYRTQMHITHLYKTIMH